MKRLMSMMLALLMLVGMALAEETPDAALGDWYALNTEKRGDLPDASRGRHVLL